jgi:hypothetical protein
MVKLRLSNWVRLLGTFFLLGAGSFISYYFYIRLQIVFANSISTLPINKTPDIVPSLTYPNGISLLPAFLVFMLIIILGIFWLNIPWMVIDDKGISVLDPYPWKYTLFRWQEIKNLKETPLLGMSGIYLEVKNPLIFQKNFSKLTNFIFVLRKKLWQYDYWISTYGMDVDPKQLFLLISEKFSANK